MVRGGRVFHPDVLIKADPVVSMTLSKKAKAVRNAEGRLIPWIG
jgi:hypothetical protein